MRVIVVGAGRTGKRVAEHLSKNHDVVVVDRDEEAIAEVSHLDVLTVVGDATLPETLEEAEVEKADYLIATTDDDATNIVVCSLGKTLGNPFTVARVKRLEYLRLWGRGREALGVNLMVSSVPLVAKSIANVIEFPQLRQLRNLYDGIYVGDALEVPEGLWYAEVGGRKIVVATMEELKRAYRPRKPKNVLILGGSEVAVMLAEMLIRKGCDVKVVERNRERAERVSSLLEDTAVIVGNPFSRSLWRDEELDEAEVSVSAFDEDERTLMGAMVSREWGIERAFAVVHDGELIAMFERAGITAVSPEVVTADRIVFATRGENALGLVASIPGVRVLAVEVDEKLASRTPDELPGTLGPVLRDGEVILPTASFHLQEGDVITLIVEEEMAGELEL
ncbi:NAD-binding protein [Thermococcus sp.]|uniref:NAD-binding protein n=1 Tax=Thermococcus sp. TaxID=35749 RepID=UPI0026223246|nr:NAD-binding protein [Thermococcus sp.]